MEDKKVPDEFKVSAREMLIYLTVFVDKVREYISVITIMNDKQRCGQMSPFVEICREAMEQQSISLISRVLDKDSFKENKNCSFKQMQKIYEEKCPDSEVIHLIKQMYESYEKVMPAEVRNKKLAHIDLDVLTENKCYEVSFEEEKDLAEKMCDILKLVSKKELGEELIFFSIEELVDRLEKGLPIDRISFVAESERRWRQASRIIREWQIKNT